MVRRIHNVITIACMGRRAVSERRAKSFYYTVWFEDVAHFLGYFQPHWGDYSTGVYFLSSKTGSVICIIVNFEPSIIVKYMLRITTIHAQKRGIVFIGISLWSFKFTESLFGENYRTKLSEVIFSSWHVVDIKYLVTFSSSS